MKNKCTITYRQGHSIIKEEVASKEQYDRLMDMSERFEISIKEVSVTRKKQEGTD